MDVDTYGSISLPGQMTTWQDGAELARQLTVLCLGIGLLADTWPEGDARDALGVLTDVVRRLASSTASLVASVRSTAVHAA